ncbi:MAG: hypothetical protein ACHQ49_07670 [Elusimicrobiota bacterium]
MIELLTRLGKILCAGIFVVVAPSHRDFVAVARAAGPGKPPRP